MKISAEIQFYLENDVNSIRSKYIEYMANNLFVEAYSKFEISWENIKSSLIVLSKKIKEIKNISNEKIVDFLNFEFAKIDVCFDEYFKKDKKSIYKQSGIVFAEADFLIYVHVDDKFFEILKEGRFSKIEQLSKDLFCIYAHEKTHVEQIKKQKIKQCAVEAPQNKNNLSIEKYLQDPRELDARAREFANFLLLKDFDKKEIEKLLSTREGNSQLLKISDIYKLYWTFFGVCLTIPKKSLDEDAKKRIKIFNKFKKRTCDFLSLDLKFVFKEMFNCSLGHQI